VTPVPGTDSWTICITGKARAERKLLHPASTLPLGDVNCTVPEIWARHGRPLLPGWDADFGEKAIDLANISEGSAKVSSGLGNEAKARAVAAITKKVNLSHETDVTIGSLLACCQAGGAISNEEMLSVISHPHACKRIGRLWELGQAKIALRAQQTCDKAIVDGAWGGNSVGIEEICACPEKSVIMMIVDIEDFLKNSRGDNVHDKTEGRRVDCLRRLVLGLEKHLPKNHELYDALFSGAIPDNISACKLTHPSVITTMQELLRRVTRVASVVGKQLSERNNERCKIEADIVAATGTTINIPTDTSPVTMEFYKAALAANNYDFATGLGGSKRNQVHVR